MPSALRDYREHYQFLGPSCLCPLLQRVSKEPAFTEAAIYIPVFGRFAGEYVAECANSRCGYLGQSPSLPKKAASVYSRPVPLQRVYQAAGISTWTFPPQGKLGAFLGAQSAYHMLRRGGHVVPPPSPTLMGIRAHPKTVEADLCGSR